MQIPLDQRNPLQAENRISKSCNHAITLLHKIFKNLRKVLAKEFAFGQSAQKLTKKEKK